MKYKLFIYGLLYIIFINTQIFSQVFNSNIDFSVSQNKNTNLVKKLDSLKTIKNITGNEQVSSFKYSSPSIITQIDTSYYDSLIMQSLLSRFLYRNSLMKKIKIFGEQFFLFNRDGFIPSIIGPVPEDYVFGPGDEFSIYLWGEVQKVYNVKVQKDGSIFLPYIGKIVVSGLTYDKLKKKLTYRLTKVFSTLNYGKSSATTFLDIIMTKYRSIKIFVVGEALNPGAYTLSGFTNIYSAIYFTGGPSKTGSYREILIKRNKKIVEKIDLYDFLIYGNIKSDFRLKDGDIIVFTPRKKLVKIKGAVLREFTYELKENETLGDLIKLAGGLKSTANIENVRITRIITDSNFYKENKKEIFLSFKNREELYDSDFLLYDNDEIYIPEIYIKPKNRVIVKGQGIKYPGTYAIDDSIKTLKDILKVSGAKKDIIDKIIILRRIREGKYKAILLNIEEGNNFQLKNEDIIYTFLQREFFIYPKIKIMGAVNRPGMYNYYKDLTVSKLLVLARGFRYDADTTYVEVNRIDRNSDRLYVNIARLKYDRNLNLLEGKELKLLPGDVVIVRVNPNLVTPKLVKIYGEVRYPGEYLLTNNTERISDLIERAGGVKSSGYLKAGVLWRDSIKVNIDLENAYKNPKSPDNIILKEGDSIYIPKLEYTVKVEGEVQFPSLIVWRRGKGIDYYISQAGGFTENADPDRVVGYQPNGKRIIQRTCWFDDRVEPGAYIYVPKRKNQRFDWSYTLSIIKDIVGIVSSAVTTAYLIYTIQNNDDNK